MLDNNVLTLILVFLNVLLFALIFVCATFAIFSHQELRSLRSQSKTRDMEVACLKEAMRQVDRSREDWSHAISNVIQAYPDVRIDDVISKYKPEF